MSPVDAGAGYTRISLQAGDSPSSEVTFTKEEIIDESGAVNYRCSNCRAEVKKKQIQRCGRCKKAQYCSVVCQKEHWFAHKAICGKAEADYDMEHNTANQLIKNIAGNASLISILDEYAFRLLGLNENKNAESRFIIKVVFSFIPVDSLENITRNLKNDNDDSLHLGEEHMFTVKSIKQESWDEQSTSTTTAMLKLSQQPPLANFDGLIIFYRLTHDRKGAYGVVKPLSRLHLDSIARNPRVKPVTRRGKLKVAQTLELIHGAFHSAILQDTNNTMKLRGIFNVHRRDIELTKYMALAAVSGNDGSKIISEEIRLKSNRVLCVCSNCGIDGENLKYCGRCGMTQYCSRECQLDHWRIHKANCSHRKRDIEPPNSTSVGDLASDLIQSIGSNRALMSILDEFAVHLLDLTQNPSNTPRYFFRTKFVIAPIPPESNEDNEGSKPHGLSPLQSGKTHMLTLHSVVKRPFEDLPSQQKGLFEDRFQDRKYRTEVAVFRLECEGTPLTVMVARPIGAAEAKSIKGSPKVPIVFSNGEVNVEQTLVDLRGYFNDTILDDDCGFGLFLTLVPIS